MNRPTGGHGNLDGVWHLQQLVSYARQLHEMLAEPGGDGANELLETELRHVYGEIDAIFARLKLA